MRLDCGIMCVVTEIYIYIYTHTLDMMVTYSDLVAPKLRLIIIPVSILG